MPFSEATKLAVKRRAHFSCCLCHSIGVQAHHVVPEAQGGDSSEDNAAPLCALCHDTYGQNPDKRKFIREARDLWYDICDRRFRGDADRLEEIAGLLENTATKDDVNTIADKVCALVQDVRDSASRSDNAKREELSQLTGMLGTTPLGGVSAGRHCKKCGTTIGLFIGDQGRCPQCGSPW